MTDPDTSAPDPPPVGTRWRHATRPIVTYTVIEHLPLVRLPDGRELSREALCERSDHRGKRLVHKRLSSFDLLDGHLIPLEQP